MNMGINTIEAVLPAALPPSHKLVLFMLAYHNNDKTNACMPSIATLAKETGLAARSISRVIKDLEAWGYVRRERRMNDKGKDISNRYAIVMPEGDSVSGMTVCRGEGDSVSGSRVTVCQGESDRVSSYVGDCVSPSLEQNYNKNMEQEERRRAKRLPPDWTPSPKDIEFCRNTRPDLDVNETAASFRDYWLSKPSNATKLDWSMAWRNWVRKERPKYTNGKQVKPFEQQWAEWLEIKQEKERTIDVDAREVGNELITY